MINQLLCGFEDEMEKISGFVQTAGKWMRANPKKSQAIAGAVGGAATIPFTRNLMKKRRARKLAQAQARMK